MEHMRMPASAVCITDIDLLFSTKKTFINLSPLNIKKLVTRCLFRSKAWLECKELRKILLKVTFSLTLLQYFFQYYENVEKNISKI